MKVICIKLSSGEEVIARLVSNGPQTLMGTSLQVRQSPFEGPEPWQVGEDLIVEKVRVIGVHQVSPTQMGVGLTPWAIGNTDGTFRITASHVTAVYTAITALEESYLQETSEIALGTKASILSAPNTRM